MKRLVLALAVFTLVLAKTPDVARSHTDYRPWKYAMVNCFTKHIKDEWRLGGVGYRWRIAPLGFDASVDSWGLPCQNFARIIWMHCSIDLKPPDADLWMITNPYPAQLTVQLKRLLTPYLPKHGSHRAAS